jgi:hypothetical protein
MNHHGSGQESDLPHLISALSTLSIFLLLDFSLPFLAVFVIFYGFFAGGFTSTYAGTVQELRRISTAADLGSIFRLLSAGRGVGNIICGPIMKDYSGHAIFCVWVSVWHSHHLHRYHRGSDADTVDDKRIAFDLENGGESHTSNDGYVVPRKPACSNEIFQLTTS